MAELTEIGAERAQADFCTHPIIYPHGSTVCQSLCNQNVLYHIQRIEFSVHLVMGGFYTSCIEEARKH